MTRSSPPERGSPERPQSTTIRTVAEAAKVSVATVSRVINGNDGVQPKLAARVHQAIQRLNYIPSTQARSMRSGRSRVLGVIAPECANPLSPAMVHSFHNAAAEYDCDVLFYHLDSKAMPIDIYVRRLIERDAEGIVVVASQLHQVPANHTWQPRIPMVFIDVGSPAKDAAVISIDYTQGIRQAVQHLAALGHRRIAFCSRQIRSCFDVATLTAFENSLEECGILPNAAWMIEVDHSCQSGLEMMEKLLSASTKPTALISTDSVTAIGALRWLYRQGIRVPDDFSVIGFDHGQIGGMAVPPLTTIEIDHVALAKAAVGALRQPPKSDSTAGRRPSQKIATQLIVRESTSFPAGTMISLAATALERRIGEFA